MPQLPSFAEFFAAVHGRPPFPWQERLAALVLSEGWPDLLDLPTGSGKTSALDIALFGLAHAPDRLPRRTVLVVDRRIVVDQGAEHALRLQRALADATDGPLKAVADALRRLSWKGDDSTIPVTVAVMRGGMPRDNDWAKRPDQAMLGVSTVDQLGSRLLFRGYGISPRSASIHAGLVGNDTLILLDEVHLAVPFSQTLSAIQRRYRNSQRKLPDRFKVVRMSATTGAVEPTWKVFGLEADDTSHPVLSRRLSASKPAQLVRVKVRGDTEVEKLEVLAGHAVEHALRLQEHAPVVGLVLNRVDTARFAYRLLRQKHPNETDAILVTGRMRAIDRDELVRNLLSARVGPRQERTAADRPLVLVATQCIEAGADFDFDALVTECASLDALRQRFGRLDRQGSRGESRAVILGRADAVAPGAWDTIYGGALSRTWEWLQGVAKDGVVDFGIDYLPPATGEHGTPMLDVLAQTADAPVLLPAHLDAWAQTSHRPAVDPDVSQWLHDPTRASADVQVLWRTELELPDPDAGDLETNRQSIVRALFARRPSALESISLPIAAARRWLAQEPATLIADVGLGAPDEDQESRRATASANRIVALRWTGDDSEFIAAKDILPGDVLVVPLSRGGITARNFDPDSHEPVTDVGDIAQLRGRGIASLLLHPEALRIWNLPSGPEPPLPDDEETLPETRTRLAEWLATWPDVRPRECPATDGEWETLKTALSGRSVQIDILGERLLARAPVPTRRALLPIAEALTEDDDSSFRDREVTLAAHSRDVREFAAGFAAALGFDPELGSDVELAAWLHDVGKADPRFQVWLVGGSQIRAAVLPEALAKSALPPGSVAARNTARRRAGYPAGYRHELLSLAMIEHSSRALDRAHDKDLVLHLVASHHGWCRPFAPMNDSPDDVQVELDHGGIRLAGHTRHRLGRLDSGVGDRFWSLLERYGWWGLAWLEAILRLADHRASEMETEAAQ